MELSDSTLQNKEQKLYIETFIKLIKKDYNDLPATQRKLADQYFEHPELLHCFSLVELSTKTGISQATIIRFCRSLGYKGFLEFSKDIKQALQAELSSSDRFNLTSKAEKPVDPFDLKSIQHLFEVGKTDLNELHETINNEDFAKSVQEMHEADKIFIIGRLSSYPLAIHFFQMLSKTTDNVVLIDDENIQSIATVNSITANSVLFSISFPRYPKSTLNIVKKASEKGATVISLTNSRLCPTVPLSKYTLITPVEVISYIDVYISPLALISALAISFSEIYPGRTQKFLSAFDSYAEENSLFIK